MAKVGIVAAAFSGLSFAELQELARAAESAGIDAIFSPEFMNDGLANCQVMAQATSRIPLMTYVTCPTFRYHPASPLSTYFPRNGRPTGLSIHRVMQWPKRSAKGMYIA